MTSMREKVEKILHEWADENDGSALAAECDYGGDLLARLIPLIRLYGEEEFRRGAMSRIKGPSYEQIERYSQENTSIAMPHEFCAGADFVLDNLKITPLSTEDALPDQETFCYWFGKSNTEIYAMLDEHVRSKLAGK